MPANPARGSMRATVRGPVLATVRRPLLLPFLLTVALLLLPNFDVRGPGAGALGAQTPAGALSPEDRVQIVRKASALLLERYVFPDVAEEVARALEDDLRAGRLDHVTDADAFAEALSRRIRDVSGDGHLWVSHQPGPYPPPAPTPPTAEEVEAQRRHLAASNFGFSRAEVLSGNVGVLEIRQFVSPSHGAEAAVAALSFLGNVDALILDLRRNAGGSPDMVAFVAGFLFPEAPVHLFDIHRRPGARTDQFWSDRRRLPDSSLGRVPIYVLTASSTFSAGEGLAYILKHAREAVVVGERTAGGAHPGAFHRLDERFLLFVAEARVTAAATGENWEGIGVTPQVEVPAEEALEAAHRMALKALQGPGDGPEPTAPGAAEPEP
jgi:retinol-binding protein 3